ncbi:MAG: hypothetical protein JWQ43_1467 [Glaciihabitans sp.]|nr:hypothetical protein [Glaciihabitans sp.]
MATWTKITVGAIIVFVVGAAVVLYGLGLLGNSAVA